MTSVAAPLAAGTIPGSTEDPMLQPDTKAPDFEVEDHTGAVVRLSDLAGTRFVLWFYPKADTPG